MGDIETLIGLVHKYYGYDTLVIADNQSGETVNQSLIGMEGVSMGRCVKRSDLNIDQALMSSLASWTQIPSKNCLRSLLGTWVHWWIKAQVPETLSKSLPTTVKMFFSSSFFEMVTPSKASTLLFILIPTKFFTSRAFPPSIILAMMGKCAQASTILNLYPEVTPLIMLLMIPLTVPRTAVCFLFWSQIWNKSFSFLVFSSFTFLRSKGMCLKDLLSFPRGPVTVMSLDLTSMVIPSGISSSFSVRMYFIWMDKNNQLLNQLECWGIL